MYFVYKNRWTIVKKILFVIEYVEYVTLLVIYSKVQMGLPKLSEIHSQS